MRNKKLYIITIPIIMIIALLTVIYVRYYTVGAREINYNGEMCVLYNDGIYMATGDVAERHTKFVGYIDIEKRVYIEKDDDTVMYVNDIMYKKLTNSDAAEFSDNSQRN